MCDLAFEKEGLAFNEEMLFVFGRIVLWRRQGYINVSITHNSFSNSPSTSGLMHLW